MKRVGGAARGTVAILLTIAAMAIVFGVAAAPVLNVADLLHDPHYAARGTFVEIQHPLGFPETVYADYVKSSRASVPYQPGPAMGQDNERVFRQLMNMSAERHQQLINDKTIY